MVSIKKEPPMSVQERHRGEICRHAIKLAVSGETSEQDSLVGSLGGAVAAMCMLADMTGEEFAEVAINMQRHMANEVLKIYQARSSC